MEVLFTSLDGGAALRQRILRLINEASTLAASHAVALHVMTFAFTDPEVADALADAAVTHKSLHIRLLADWSQRTRVRGQQVGRLAQLHLPNLQVRYSYDQPYVWHAAAQHMRWSYHASRGLLHHKTLGVFVDGRPRQLLCGSFNWTAAAASSYEHLLVLSNEQAASREIMARMELEFGALWSDGRISLSPDEAQLHYEAILEEYRANPAAAPASIAALAQGAGAPWPTLPPECWPPTRQPGTAPFSIDPIDPINTIDPIDPHNTGAAIAFAWRGREQRQGQAGAAEPNRSQRLFLRLPSGRVRFVPLTITNLALAAIHSAGPGHTLRLAMYGLSPRVPEYAALLDAARRGVRLLVILDRLVASSVASRLQAAAKAEALPVQVRTTGRMMHQKYLVLAETATIVTGTANMSTDASCRHTEHRMLLRGDQELAARFCADFDKIWGRLKG
jgi:phosphatidylserine/phosphatidylglycerophosphate/cardiolipin synthase-like enzyme